MSTGLTCAARKLIIFFTKWRNNNIEREKCLVFVLANNKRHPTLPGYLIIKVPYFPYEYGDKTSGI